MVIHTLELNNFRNYDSLSLEFDKKTNILYGDNAQGKTNILEAIYICSVAKSHKGSMDKDVIKMDRDESHIRMRLEKRDRFYKIDMHLKKNKTKGIAIDGIPIKKSTELIGLSNVVFFSPEDLRIIKNGPSERRRFINMELCQIDKVYLHRLIQYNKVLEQRNHLLKQIGFNRDLMDTLYIWNDKLVEYGKSIIEERESFLLEMNEIIRSIHKKLTGQKEELHLLYEPSVTSEEFHEKLSKSIDRDLQMKMTNVGPHRDDVSFIVNDKDMRRFGSQGQQRTAALSLKLAEIEIVKKRMLDAPILLLDDVLSELDRNRQNYLLDSIDDIQTMITCTGLEEFIHRNTNTNSIFQVVGGEVRYMEGGR